MLALSQAGILTAGLHSGIGDLGVALCGNSLLSDDDLAALVAVLALSQAGILTAGLSGSVDDFGMSLHHDCCLVDNNIIVFGIILTLDGDLVGTNGVHLHTADIRSYADLVRLDRIFHGNGEICLCHGTIHTDLLIAGDRDGHGPLGDGQSAVFDRHDIIVGLVVSSGDGIFTHILTGSTVDNDTQLLIGNITGSEGDFLAQLRIGIAIDLALIVDGDRDLCGGDGEGRIHSLLDLVVAGVDRYVGGHVILTDIFAFLTDHFHDHIVCQIGRQLIDADLHFLVVDLIKRCHHIIDTILVGKSPVVDHIARGGNAIAGVFAANVAVALQIIRKCGICIAIDLGRILHIDLHTDRFDEQQCSGTLRLVALGVCDHIHFISTHIHGSAGIEGDDALCRQMLQHAADIDQIAGGAVGISLGIRGDLHIIDQVGQCLDQHIREGIDILTAQQIAQLCDSDGIGQLDIQHALHGLQHIHRIRIQFKVDGVVFTVNDHGQVVCGGQVQLGILVGKVIGDRDKVSVAVIRNDLMEGAEVQRQLLDDQQTGIGGNVVVGIGNDTVIEVVTGLAVGNAIGKGDSHILRHLLQHRQQPVHSRVHLGDEAIDVIGVRAERHQFLCRDRRGQIITVRGDKVDQIVAVGALAEPFMTGQAGIQPSGQIDIDIAMEGIHTDLVDIAGNISAAGDQDVVRLQAGNGRAGLNGSSVSIAVVLHGTTGHIDAGCGQANDHIAHIGTIVTNLTVFVTLNIDSRHLVHTCVDRCIFGPVSMTVGLHADIVQGQFSVGRIEGIAFQIEDAGADTLCGIIKYGPDIFDLNRTVAGNDQDGPCDHIADDDLAIQLKGDVRDLDIGTIGQGRRIGVDRGLVVGVDADELISDHFGRFFVPDISALVVCGSPQINILQKITGVYTVLILVVPLQLHIRDSGNDDQQSGIHGGIMIGICHHCDDGIGAHIGVGDVITEGQDHICRHLFQYRDHIIDGVGNGSKDLVLRAMLFQGSGDLRQLDDQLVGQLTNGDTVGDTGGILRDQGIDPCGEVNIHRTVDSLPAVLGELAVRSDAGGDDSGIGRGHTGICRRSYLIRRIMGNAGLNSHDPVRHLDGGCCRLDRQNTGIRTDAGQVEQILQRSNIEGLKVEFLKVDLFAVIELQIDHIGCIHTCVHRLFAAVVDLAVGLDADIADLQLGILAQRDRIPLTVAVNDLAVGVSDNDTKALRLIVEGLQQVIVGISGGIHQGHIDLTGDQDECTDDGHSIIQLIAPQNAVSDLHIGTVVLDGLRNHPDIGIDIAVDVRSQEVAGIIVDTQQEILHIEALNGIAGNGSTLVHSVPLGQGHDAVVDGRIPFQRDLVHGGSDDQVIGGVGSLVIGIDGDRAGNIHTDIRGMEVLILNDDPDLRAGRYAGNGLDDLVQDTHGVFVQTQSIIQIIDQIGELGQGEFALEVFAHEGKLTDGLGQAQLDESNGLTQTHDILILTEVHSLRQIQTDQELDHLRLNGGAIVVCGGCDRDGEVIAVAIGDVLGIVVDIHRCLIDGHIHGDPAGLIDFIACKVQGGGLGTCMLVKALRFDLQTGDRSAIRYHGSAGSGNKVSQTVAIGNGAVIGRQRGGDTVVIDGHIGDGLCQGVLIVHIADADDLGGAVTGRTKGMGADGQALQLLGDVIGSLRGSQLAVGDLVDDFLDQLADQLVQVILRDRGTGGQPQLTQVDIQGTQLDDGEAQVDAAQFHGNTALCTSQILDGDLAVVDGIGIGILHGCIHDIPVHGSGDIVGELVDALVLQLPFGTHGLDHDLVVHLLLHIHGEGCSALAVGQFDRLTVDGSGADGLSGNGSELELIGAFTDDSVHTCHRIQLHDRSGIVGHEVGCILDGDLDRAVVGDIFNRHIFKGPRTGLVLRRTGVGHGNCSIGSVLADLDGIVHIELHIQGLALSQDGQAHRILQVFDQLGLIHIGDTVYGNFALNIGCGTLVHQSGGRSYGQGVIGLIVHRGTPGDAGKDLLTVIQRQQRLVGHCLPGIVDRIDGEVHGECATVGSQEVSGIFLAQDGIDHILCGGDLGLIVRTALVHLHLEVTGLSLLQAQDVILRDDLVLAVRVHIEGHGSIVSHGILPTAVEDIIPVDQFTVASGHGKGHFGPLAIDEGIDFDGLDIGRGAGIGLVVDLIQDTQDIVAAGGHGDGQSSTCLEVADTLILTGILAVLDREIVASARGRLGLNGHGAAVAGVEHVQSDGLLEGAVLVVGVAQPDGLGAALAELMGQRADAEGGRLGNIRPQLDIAGAGIGVLKGDIILRHGSGGAAKERLEHQLLQIVGMILIVHAVDDGGALVQSQVVLGIFHGDGVDVGDDGAIGLEGYGTVLRGIRDLLGGVNGELLTVLVHGDGLHHIGTAGGHGNGNGIVAGDGHVVLGGRHRQGSACSQSAVGDHSAVLIGRLDIDGQLGGAADVAGIVCIGHGVDQLGGHAGGSRRPGAFCQSHSDCQSVGVQGGVGQQAVDIVGQTLLVIHDLHIGDLGVGQTGGGTAIHDIHGHGLGNAGGLIRDIELSAGLGDLHRQEEHLPVQDVGDAGHLVQVIEVASQIDLDGIVGSGTGDARCLQHIRLQGIEDDLVLSALIVAVDAKGTIGGIQGVGTEADSQGLADGDGGGSLDHIVHIAVSGIGIDKLGGDIDDLVGSIGGIPQVGIDIALLAQQGRLAGGSQGDLTAAGLGQGDRAGLGSVIHIIVVAVVGIPFGGEGDGAGICVHDLVPAGEEHIGLVGGSSGIGVLAVQGSTGDLGAIHGDGPVGIVGGAVHQLVIVGVGQPLGGEGGIGSDGVLAGDLDAADVPAVHDHAVGLVAHRQQVGDGDNGVDIIGLLFGSGVVVGDIGHGIGLDPLCGDDDIAVDLDGLAGLHHGALHVPAVKAVAGVLGSGGELSGLALHDGVDIIRGAVVVNNADAVDGLGVEDGGDDDIAADGLGNSLALGVSAVAVHIPAHEVMVFLGGGGLNQDGIAVVVGSHHIGLAVHLPGDGVVDVGGGVFGGHGHAVGGDGAEVLVPAGEGVGIGLVGLTGGGGGSGSCLTVFHIGGTQQLAVIVQEGDGIVAGGCDIDGSDHRILHDAVISNIPAGEGEVLGIGGSLGGVGGGGGCLTVGHGLGIQHGAVLILEDHGIGLGDLGVGGGVGDRLGDRVHGGIPAGEGVGRHHMAVLVDLVRLGGGRSHDLGSCGTVGILGLAQDGAVVVDEGDLVGGDVPHDLTAEIAGSGKPGGAAVGQAVADGVGVGLALNGGQGDRQAGAGLAVGIVVVPDIDGVGHSLFEQVQGIVAAGDRGAEGDGGGLTGLLGGDSGIGQGQGNDLAVGGGVLDDLDLQGTGLAVGGNGETVRIDGGQHIPVAEGAVVIQIEVAGRACDGIDPHMDIVLGGDAAAHDCGEDVVLQVVELLLLVAVQGQDAALVGQGSGGIGDRNGIGGVVLKGDGRGKDAAGIGAGDGSAVDLHLVHIHGGAVGAVQVSGGDRQGIGTGSQGAVRSQAAEVHGAAAVAGGGEGDGGGVRLCGGGDGDDGGVALIVVILGNGDLVAQDRGLTAGGQGLALHKFESDGAGALCSYGVQDGGIDVRLGGEGDTGVGVVDGGLRTAFDQGDLSLHGQACPCAGTGQEDLFSGLVTCSEGSAEGMAGIAGMVGRCSGQVGGSRREADAAVIIITAQTTRVPGVILDGHIPGSDPLGNGGTGVDDSIEDRLLQHIQLGSDGLFGVEANGADGGVLLQGGGLEGDGDGHIGLAHGVDIITVGILGQEGIAHLDAFDLILVAGIAGLGSGLHQSLTARGQFSLGLERRGAVATVDGGHSDAVPGSLIGGISNGQRGGLGGCVLIQIGNRNTRAVANRSSIALNCVHSDSDSAALDDILRCHTDAGTVGGASSNGSGDLMVVLDRDTALGCLICSPARAGRLPPGTPRYPQWCR